MEYHPPSFATNLLRSSAAARAWGCRAGEAKTHFSKLVAVEAGETVVICRNGEPVMECVPARPAGPFPFGAWGELAPGTRGLAHLVGPTDEDLLDAMGL
jgi:antitoxin (DNA-binding transcriptional repressor) of toxin-antitoxin stability system